jgi:CHAD domain-containing protein
MAGGPTATPRTVRAALARQVAALERSARALAAHPGRREVHEHRRQARRTEAVTHLLEPFLRPPAYTRLRALTAGLGRGLGRLRDADVMGRRLQRIAAAPPAARAGLEALAKRVAARSRKGRKARAHAARRRARPKRLRDPVQRLLERAAGPRADPLRVPSARLRLRARRVVASHASPESLHALRLELKAFGYAAEALAQAKVPGTATAAREARAACKALGRYTDALALALLAADADGAARAHLEAVAREDAAAARAAFGAAWAAGRWPALQRRWRTPPSLARQAFEAGHQR